VAGLLGPAPARADVRIIARESLNGHATSTTTHWFGDGKRARIDGDSVVVTRLDLGKIYLIDRARQTFQARDLATTPGAAAVSAVPTGETAIIGRWLCRKYRIEGAATHGRRISLWVTRDMDIDSSAFAKLMADFGRQSGAEWLQAYAQIDGFPVMQEISLTRGSLTQSRSVEVISADTLSAPPETYLPPRGYKKTS
jgi:hypothetical protein